MVRAISKSSLTIRAPSPTYFCTSSEPMTLMKQASVRFATARAHSVFPVPGGPYIKTPFGGSIPKLTNFSGFRRGISTTSRSFSIASYTRVKIDTPMRGRYLAATHVRVGDVRLFLHGHHGHRRVNFGRERNVDLVLSAVNAYAHSLFNIRRGDLQRCLNVRQPRDHLPVRPDQPRILRIA